MTGTSAGPRTVLATGFSGFPGMPFNPTERFVRRLDRVAEQSRDGRLVTAILPVSWKHAPRMLDALIEAHRPDAIVLFGVAGRSRTLRIEGRAKNRTTKLLPDAEGTFAQAVTLEADSGSYRHSTISAHALKEIARRTGCPTVLSKDAGAYLCNAALWHAIATGIPSVFVHWPMPTPRQGYSRASARKPDFALLEAASRAILKAVIRRELRPSASIG